MKALIVALLLSLLLPPVQQEAVLKERTKSFRNSKRFSVKYDKFRDDTMISVGPFFVGKKLGQRLQMSAFIFLGNSPVRQAYLQFQSSSREWRFLKDSEFLALIDGQRKDFGEGDRDSHIGSGVVSELMVYVIPLDDFIKMGRAGQLEFQIGRVELILEDEHKEAFRDLLTLTK